MSGNVDLSGGPGTVNLSGQPPASQPAYKDMNYSIDPGSVSGGAAPSQGGGFSTSNPMLNIAGSTAKAALDRSVEEIKNFIEQNPSSVRVAVFGMSLCTVTYCALGIFNIFRLVFNPTEYLVNFYLMCFAATTLVLEGKPEWPMVATFQEKIFYQAHFLSTIHGRAMFYIFQGTFGMARFPTEKDGDFLMFIFGMGYFFVGVLILVQQYKARGRGPTGFETRENLLVDQYKINP